MNEKSLFAIAALAVSAYLSAACFAQETPPDKAEEAPTAAAASSESSDTELAKKTQNPVADLISVPLQNNFNFNVGQGNDMQYVLNIQPVIPLSLTPEWNLITRTIIPVIDQPALGPQVGDECGVGDIQFSAFLSPAKPGEWIWGVGPVMLFPTASEDVLGTEKWSAGPSAVALRMDGHWVYGALVQHVWSYAGDSDRDYVSQTLIQPFVNYNLKHGWYLTSVPIITANWNADSSDIWTIPVGGGVGKIIRLGKLPVNLQTQAFYNTVSPDGGADWSVRFQIQLLFPK